MLNLVAKCKDIKKLHAYNKPKAERNNSLDYFITYCKSYHYHIASNIHQHHYILFVLVIFCSSLSEYSLSAESEYTTPYLKQFCFPQYLLWNPIKMISICRNDMKSNFNGAESITF